MGADSMKAPPLPCPTESECFETPTELATDISKAADEKSSYSLPDDGTPVTIKTRGHRPNRSQTSLLIEYFEGGKNGQGGSHERKPSVRVRLTPSKGHGKSDHIQITETRSTRRSSTNRRATASPAGRSEIEMTDPEDARSMNSYASATEESNVSRNPIEVEIDSSRRRNNRKASSPLIPTADSKVSSYIPQGDMSDISAIPTDSFLDGSGGNTTATKDEKRARSPLRTDAAAAGNDTERPNRRSRSERGGDVDKPTKQERRYKSRSRADSVGEKEVEGRSSGRRKSKGTHRESIVSGVESSVLSSQLTGSHRSYDSYASSKVSINNPKLLETVEDAIRRLILPELDAIKRERSQRDSKTSSKHRDSLQQRDSLSSLTSASRDELSTKRKSVDTSKSTKSKDQRNREARNDLSPQSSSLDEVSVLEEEIIDDDLTPRRDRGRLTDVALGAAGATAVDAALRSKSRVDEKRQRRRRRAETSKRDHSEGYHDDFDEMEHHVAPPMPLSSEINPSEMTRTSLLSADTDRPHSASEEMTPVMEVPRGVASVESMHDTPTPTRSPEHTLQHLGTQHANVSHGDLKALPRKGPTRYKEESEVDEYGRQHLSPIRDEYEDEYDDEGQLAEPGMYDDENPHQSFFGHQDVPAPLRYVPYQQERRGLSPIQSVSGFTEGESDIQGHRDSRITQTASELSSPDKSIHQDRDSRAFCDEESSVRSSGLDYRNTTYTDDSELDHVTSGQAVRNVSANARMVHQNFGPESAVASLIEGSALDPSLLSASANGGPDYGNSQVSYDTGRDAGSSDLSATKQPGDGRRDTAQKSYQSPALSQDRPVSATSREVSEYDVNEYGHKVPLTKERQSPTASEAAITSAALGRAAAAALKRQNAVHHSPSRETNNEDFVGEGVSRNRSFKERAKDHYIPDARPRHSADRLSDYDHPKLGASGLPDVDHPMPEIGYGYDDQQSDRQTPEPLGDSHHEREDHWPAERTPTAENAQSYDRVVTPKASRGNVHGFGTAESAAAATITTAGALAASHSRQPSQEQDNEWHRTSSERKRDTLITNPYEGTSPIANLPGLDGNMLNTTGFGTDAYRGGFHTGSPGLAGGDEGYISAAPNEAANAKGRGVGIGEQQPIGNTEDPFYTAKQTRHLSGMSQGMTSPLYDPASGTGIDRIQSKDIIALMEHVRISGLIRCSTFLFTDSWTAYGSRCTA